MYPSTEVTKTILPFTPSRTIRFEAAWRIQPVSLCTAAEEYHDSLKQSMPVPSMSDPCLASTTPRSPQRRNRVLMSPHTRRTRPGICPRMALWTHRQPHSRFWPCRRRRSMHGRVAWRIDGLPGGTIRRSRLSWSQRSIHTAGRKSTTNLDLFQSLVQFLLVPCDNRDMCTPLSQQDGETETQTRAASSNKKII